MKRLLLSCALIGATFACNAMTPKKKFNEIYELATWCELTVKKVNENLFNNEYMMNNKEEYLDLVLDTQETLKVILPYFLGYFDGKPRMNKRDKKCAHNLLGYIRLRELAHELGEGVEGYDQLDMDGLPEAKAKLEAFIRPAEEEKKSQVPICV